MASLDKLTYFDLFARGEFIRMLYAISGTPFKDERVDYTKRLNPDLWPEMRKEYPFGKLPILTTEDGMLNQSSAIARYVAKKTGLYGKDVWEEALHDMIIENSSEAANQIPPKVYVWKVFKREPEPENSEENIKQVRESWLKCATYIQSVAEKRGRKFLVSDEIGAGDVVFYSKLEFSKMAIPDIMSLTPWVKDFCEKFEADERVKAYLASRPESVLGI